MKKKPASKKNPSAALLRSQGKDVFLPLLALCLFLWWVYRSVFHFSVLFDEVIGKAIFFALPVLFYLSVSGDKNVFISFSKEKIRKGLLLGLAIGGLFGFVFAIFLLFRHGSVPLGTPVFLTSWFWQELALAFLTSFWETLFFFSFVFSGIELRFPRWSLTKQVLLTAFVFLLFHIPNVFLQFSWRDALLQMILLFSFAFGQALFFSQRKNAYAAILIQVIWGMVLLVYF
jgi:hypothetical protein